MGRKANLYLTDIILACISVIAAITALLGFFASFVEPSESWFFSVISLILAPIIVVNVCFVVYFLFRRKWMLLLFPLVALVVNYSNIFAVVRLDFSSEEDNVSPCVRIATYNVHAFGEHGAMENEVRNIAEFLFEQRVDIVCFQEFMYSKKFTDEDIAYTLSFLPYHSELKFESYKDLIVTIFSRFPIQKQQIVTFEESNNRCMWADIDVDGKLLRVVNAHLQTTNVNQSKKEFSVITNNTISRDSKDAINTVTYRLKDNNIKRAQQSKIIEKIFSETELPVVVCGDFNDTPSSFTYNNLIRAGLKDGFKAAGSGYMHTYKRFMGLLRIDYILYGKNILPLDYFSPSVEYSDHNPVIFEFAIK